MIDWTKQHCGVHQGTYDQLIELMPDLYGLIQTFPEDPHNFIWDVKVHMLMPDQFPCIPNWHQDNIPRVDGKQDFSLIKPELPMYLWLSGPPLTEFRDASGKKWFVRPGSWTRFTQLDEHRGTMSTEFCWRGFIRATHRGILPSTSDGHKPHRRHTQVYLDAAKFTW